MGGDGSILTPLEDIINYTTSQDFPSTMVDYQLIESVPLTISGGTHPSYAVTFTRSEEPFGPIKTMAVFTKDGDETFAISYNAQPDQFDSYFPVVQRIIESVQFFNLDTYMNDGVPSGNGLSSPIPPDRIITPDCGVVTDGTPCYDR
jgi:hypothetical protein